MGTAAHEYRKHVAFKLWRGFGMGWAYPYWTPTTKDVAVFSFWRKRGYIEEDGASMRLTESGREHYGYRQFNAYYGVEEMNNLLERLRVPCATADSKLAADEIERLWSAITRHVEACEQTRDRTKWYAELHKLKVARDGSQQTAKAP